MTTSQEGGLSLLLSLAQPPTAATAVSPENSADVATSGTGDWEVFALAVKLLRRACMLSANRSDLLSLKVRVGFVLQVLRMKVERIF